MNKEKDWVVTFDQPTFERSKQDKKFPFILALGRVVNSLYVVHSVTTRPYGVSPAETRDRFNSFLFGSALIFEALNLIETMLVPFAKDEMFQRGLRAIYYDETSKAIKKVYLKPVRHHAVFHFDAAEFAKAIEKTPFYDCPFVSGRGDERHAINYQLADIVSAEILVGVPSDREDFMMLLADAMTKTSDLVNKFIVEAEDFIVHHLQQWGYIKKDL